MILFYIFYFIVVVGFSIWYLEPDDSEERCKRSNEITSKINEIQSKIDYNKINWFTNSRNCMISFVVYLSYWSYNFLIAPRIVIYIFDFFGIPWRPYKCHGVVDGIVITLIGTIMFSWLYGKWFRGSKFMQKLELIELYLRSNYPWRL